MIQEIGDEKQDLESLRLAVWRTAGLAVDALKFSGSRRQPGRRRVARRGLRPGFPGETVG